MLGNLQAGCWGFWGAVDQTAVPGVKPACEKGEQYSKSGRGGLPGGGAAQRKQSLHSTTR